MHVCLYPCLYTYPCGLISIRQLPKTGHNLLQNTQAIKMTTQTIMNTTFISCICFVANIGRQIIGISIYPCLLNIETCSMKRLMGSSFFATWCWVYSRLATQWLWLLSTMVWGVGAFMFDSSINLYINQMVHSMHKACSGVKGTSV